MKLKHQILIVDDDADDREIIKDAFVASQQDYEYIFFENGDKLMDYLNSCDENNFPSLVMLDLNMPGKDGRASLKEIKTDKRLHIIPVIVFTTSSSQRDKTISYDFGANCFVTKPDTFNNLADITACIAKLWFK